MLSDPITLLILCVVTAIPGVFYVFSPAYRRKAKRMEAAWKKSFSESLRRWADQLGQRSAKQLDPEAQHLKKEVQYLKERVENLETIVIEEAWNEDNRTDRNKLEPSVLDEGASLESNEKTIRQMAADVGQRTSENPESTSREKA